VSEQHRHGCRRDAGPRSIGAAGQHDADSGAKNDAGGIRISHAYELPSEHVARFQIGNKEIFALGQPEREQ
jgi:hypothetical protein